jgi:hypothetical protein
MPVIMLRTDKTKRNGVFLMGIPNTNLIKYKPTITVLPRLAKRNPKPPKKWRGRL